MRRSFFASLAAVGIAIGSTASAGERWHDFWHGVHVDFHRNNSWPEPFRTADRANSREAWCIMTDNGWKMQNTIGSILFDRETNQLNNAGDLLVKWIVTQAPQHRRAVFVYKGDSAEITATRVESVQAAVARHASGCACPVIITDTEPTGWSAAYIDSITQQFNATIPSPRLPAAEGGGGGGGGGSGGGGGGGGSGGGGGGR